MPIGDINICDDAEQQEEETVRQRWGKSIRRQREDVLKMTQKALAEAVGVSQHAVSQWEHGRRAPDVETQLKIARALRVDARILFAFPDAA